MASMKITPVLFLCLVLSACSSLSTATDYVTGHRETVPASIPEYSITKLDVYNSPKHPMKVWVESTARKISMSWGGQVDQWVAILPRIEPEYRRAALAVLQKDGATCEITGSLPFPDQLAIEFTYRCQA